VEIYVEQSYMFKQSQSVLILPFFFKLKVKSLYRLDRKDKS